MDVYYVDYLLWRMFVSGRFLRAFKLTKYDPYTRQGKGGHFSTTLDTRPWRPAYLHGFSLKLDPSDNVHHLSSNILLNTILMLKNIIYQSYSLFKVYKLLKMFSKQTDDVKIIQKFIVRVFNFKNIIFSTFRHNTITSISGGSKG